LIHAIVSTILTLSVLAWFAIIAVFAAIMLACLVGGLRSILATPATLAAVFDLFAFAAIPGVTAEDVFIVAAPGSLILILFISERQRLAERRAELAALSVSALRPSAPARRLRIWQRGSQPRIACCRAIHALARFEED
jgi:hypothetical protein